ncbi:MAG TPA: hypothetical protein VFW09_21755 [Solirubrobacteraceae bacterium]|nr:hypothetical protein [Solirubrobacteraceae bacterium]
MRRASLAAAGAVLVLLSGSAPASAAPLTVTWMRGVRSPGTPARYDRVGVLRIGPRAARNVLVLEPGT